jgi:hypothetical protein
LNDVEERRQPIDVVELTRERGGEVEAEAVDVHLEHPVAEAVHDELQRPRMAHVQRVAGPGVVHVVARVVGNEAVVTGVVDAAEAERGAELVAFGGVVVDDVEDDLDAGAVIRASDLNGSNERPGWAAACSNVSIPSYIVDALHCWWPLFGRVSTHLRHLPRYPFTDISHAVAEFDSVGLSDDQEFHRVPVDEQNIFEIDGHDATCFEARSEVCPGSWLRPDRLYARSPDRLQSQIGQF